MLGRLHMSSCLTLRVCPVAALRANVESLEKAVRERNVRGIKKSLWKTNYVRVRMTAQDLEKALQFLSNDVRAALVSAVGAISSAEATSKTDDDVDMAGESSPADDTTQSEEQPEKPVEPSKLPEVHAYVELLTMSHLFKYNLLDEVWFWFSPWWFRRVPHSSFLLLRITGVGCCIPTRGILGQVQPPHIGHVLSSRFFNALACA